MITGDNIVTACAVAKECQLVREKEVLLIATTTLLDPTTNSYGFCLLPAEGQPDGVFTLLCLLSLIRLLFLPPDPSIHSCCCCCVLLCPMCLLAHHSVTGEIEAAGIEYTRFPKLWNDTSKAHVGLHPRAAIGMHFACLLSASVALFIFVAQ